MHVTQVHQVTSENQFHCTRLYSLNDHLKPLIIALVTVRGPEEEKTCFRTSDKDGK